MDKESRHSDVEGGPARPPRLIAGRLVMLAALAALALLVALGAGRLPTGTDTASLVVRALVGLGIGLVLMVVVIRALRVLTNPPPPSPEKVDARQAEVVYTCAQCGTRLRLEVASTGKAPRHCGEEMESEIG